MDERNTASRPENRGTFTLALPADALNARAMNLLEHEPPSMLDEPHRTNVIIQIRDQIATSDAATNERMRTGGSSTR